MAVDSRSAKSAGRRRIGLRLVVLGLIAAAAVAACAFAILALLRPAPPRMHPIRMTSDKALQTVFLAEQVRTEGRGTRLVVELSTEQFGSLEALDVVDSSGEYQFALVIGGVTKSDYPNVRSVTSLQKEHLHLLVKPELADKGIVGLRGKRFFLSPSTTASHQIARDVLSFLGLRPATESKSGGYVIDPMTPQEGVREVMRIDTLGEPERSKAIANLPDVAMFLAPLPSPMVRRLVENIGYRLIPLPFAEAYGLDRLNPPTAEGVRIDRSLLSAGVIPAYTYGSAPPAPDKDCPTICAPLILVARNDADPDAVSQLLETIHDSPLTGSLRPTPLAQQVHQFPLHPGTDRFLSRNEPLLKPEHASKIGTLAGGIGALISGLIAIYSYLRLRKLNRFENYYREIGRIEMIAVGAETDPCAPAEPDSLREYLQGRLTTLKHEVLKDFAEGGLQGEGLMAGIIALINDTRESLAGMTTRPNPP